MKVCWVKIWIASMATLTERFRDDEGRVDFEALGREEYAFRHALITGDYCKSERARDLAEAAEKDYKIHSENGKKGGRPKKLTAAATHREAVDASTTGCKPLTADGDTREDSLNVTDGSNAVLLESGTSANNMRRVPQNEAPAHGFSGGRTAQGTMSRSPEAAAQSGKAYDQETDQVSTKALDKAGAGEIPPESVSAKPSPALPVPAKRPHGEFGNVMLTDDEFAKLQEKLPNVWDLVTELDQYIESQGKTKKYRSHYATLLNWSRRKAQEAKPQQRYKNINDINRENCEQIERDLRAMFHPEEVI